jgi:hypothetical protein
MPKYEFRYVEVSVWKDYSTLTSGEAEILVSRVLGLR